MWSETESRKAGKNESICHPETKAKGIKKSHPLVHHETNEKIINEVIINNQTIIHDLPVEHFR